MTGQKFQATVLGKHMEISRGVLQGKGLAAMPGCLAAAPAEQLRILCGLEWGCCNRFQCSLAGQYILVFKGVYTYLTTENIYSSKGQLNLCLNWRWAKGHCNYLLYYLCRVWVTVKAEHALPFIRKVLNKTQDNHSFCIQQIFCWTSGLYGNLSLLLSPDWGHLN